jgi:hypothetical protein
MKTTFLSFSENKMLEEEFLPGIPPEDIDFPA